MASPLEAGRARAERNGVRCRGKGVVVGPLWHQVAGHTKMREGAPSMLLLSYDDPPPFLRPLGGGEAGQGARRLVLKRLQSGQRGEVEVSLLEAIEAAAEGQAAWGLQGCAPRYYGLVALGAADYAIVGQHGCGGGENIKGKTDLKEGREEDTALKERRQEEGWEDTTREQLYLAMEDVTEGCAYPCCMDVKMGTRTYEPDASPEKKAAERAKYPLQERIGFRVAGRRTYVYNGVDAAAAGGGGGGGGGGGYSPNSLVCCSPDPSNEGDRVRWKEEKEEDREQRGFVWLEPTLEVKTKAWGRSLSEQQMPEVFRDFLSCEVVRAVSSSSEQQACQGGGGRDHGAFEEEAQHHQHHLHTTRTRLRRGAVSAMVQQLEVVERWVDQNPGAKFTASSLFFVYDAKRDSSTSHRPGVKLIDFAHSHMPKEEEEEEGQDQRQERDPCQCQGQGQGERDEGYLVGVRFLIDLLRGLLDEDEQQQEECIC